MLFFCYKNELFSVFLHCFVRGANNCWECFYSRTTFRSVSAYTWPRLCCWGFRPIHRIHASTACGPWSGRRDDRKKRHQRGENSQVLNKKRKRKHLGKKPKNSHEWLTSFQDLGELLSHIIPVIKCSTLTISPVNNLLSDVPAIIPYPTTDGNNGRAQS